MKKVIFLFYMILACSFLSASGRSPIRSYSLRLQDSGQTTTAEMGWFLWINNPSISKSQALELARLYQQESRREGINADVAFVQMCHETGFLNYGGSVRPEQYNYCGLGSVSNGITGHSFASPQEGVRAHIQHLVAYVSQDDPAEEVVDPRFALVSLRGQAELLQDLTGKWAVDPDYSKKIESILRRFYRSVNQYIRTSG